MMTFHKKKKKGFTIAEIVIALTIIAVVALTAATVLSGAYITLLKEKSITTSVLAVQKDAEHLINTQRASDTGFVLYSDCFLPNHNVRVKQFKIEKDDQIFYSLVTKVQSVADVLPKVTKASSGFLKGTATLSSDYHHAVPGLKIKGEYVMDSASMGNFMVNTVYWYASKPGYYIPSSIEAVEYAEGRLPYFPADYELITHTGDKPITDFSLEKYAGRHIVMEVVPATLRGVIGQKAHTASLYVHALPYTDHLYAHYDASCLEFSSEYYNSSTKHILKWKDITGNGRDGLISGSGNFELIQLPQNSGNYTGLDVAFNSSAKLQIPKTDKTDSSPKTVLVVRRPNPAGGSLAAYKTLFVEGEKSGRPHIREKKLADGYMLYVYDFSRWPTDGLSPANLLVSPGEIDGGIINEVIIYSAKLYDGSEPAAGSPASLIESYLLAKYAPTDASLITEIISVKDVLLTVKGGTDFVEPAQANAVLRDGRLVPVSVEWNAAELKLAKDAIKAGNTTNGPIVKVVSGHVLNAPSKNVNMVITIPVGDDIILKLDKRVVAKNAEAQLTIEMKTDDANPEVEISFSKDGIVSVKNTTVRVNHVKTVPVKALVNGRVDIKVSYGSTTRKIRLIVTEEEPPSANRALWLDAMANDSVVLNSNGKVSQWKNKDSTDARTYFRSIIADAPSYVTTYDTAYLEFTRGKNLRAEELGRGIQFKEPYDNSEMVIFIVAKLNDKASAHALFSQAHNDTRLSHINLPSYLLGADMSKDEVYHSIFKLKGDLSIEDDDDEDDDEDDDDEDLDDKVELDKKFILYGSIQHRRDIEGATYHDFFDFSLGLGQGSDWIAPDTDNVIEPTYSMMSADVEGFYIGKALGGLTLDGRVYEVLIYKGIQDATTTEKVLKYLKQKWYD